MTNNGIRLSEFGFPASFVILVFGIRGSLAALTPAFWFCLSARRYCQQTRRQCHPARRYCWQIRRHCLSRRHGAVKSQFVCKRRGLIGQAA